MLEVRIWSQYYTSSGFRRKSHSHKVKSGVKGQKLNEKQKDNSRSHYRNSRSNTLEHVFINSLNSMAGIGIGICLGISFGISGSLIFSKKIKISDNTTRDLTKGCDCMKKKSISVICAVLVISGVATVLVLTGNRGNVSNVNRVVGYSALYGENSINEAFDVIEKKFAKDFKGCTLAELRYDEDVENRFAEEIEKYHKENNQELIVVLSIFDTDEKGGDGGFNPNDTYANWQWYLVKTADKKSWEIINWGY